MRVTFAIIKIVYRGKNTLLAILVKADDRPQCPSTEATITAILAVWPEMSQHRLCCVFFSILKVQQYYHLEQHFLGKTSVNTNTLSSFSNSAFNVFLVLRSTLVLKQSYGRSHIVAGFLCFIENTVGGPI